MSFFLTIRNCVIQISLPSVASATLQPSINDTYIFSNSTPSSDICVLFYDDIKYL